MWRFSEVPRDMFARLYELALADGDEEQVKAACNQVALFLREAAESLGLEKRQHFETGLIHGDWHSGNLLFVGQSLSAILDLEFAGEGCFLEDIAYAVSNLCIRTTVEPERLRSRTNVVLDHYQFYRSLSFLEEMALYYAVGMKHIATVAFQLREENREVAGFGPANWMGRLAAQCEWLSQRAKRIRGL
jgi:Ser/Thr protein kinase RdoA (MazF antagonist)